MSDFFTSLLIGVGVDEYHKSSCQSCAVFIVYLAQSTYSREVLFRVFTDIFACSL